jgi:hypothetical protein
MELAVLDRIRYKLHLLKNFGGGHSMNVGLVCFSLLFFSSAFHIFMT